MKDANHVGDDIEDGRHAVNVTLRLKATADRPEFFLCRNPGLPWKNLATNTLLLPCRVFRVVSRKKESGPVCGEQFVSDGVFICQPGQFQISVETPRVRRLENVRRATAYFVCATLTRRRHMSILSGYVPHHAGRTVL